ncbi:thioesterase family protein [Rhodoferax mekongensis]|uniref:Thioesterase family protein n=1 Tax=Rhodoferax mekongensis TaxID=3068341 RepID=A0ABZ0AUR2_9BURK|nr:thioesterase family protein [Rhodoferax sp. TBRC 17307]WNO03382.1 thioesterase family protein [Rhodoferax sp. TBRC 17307]
MSDTQHHTAPAGATAAFTALGGNFFRASELTRGPWHPQQQHAGPPIALVSHALEAAAQAHGLQHLARLTANLLRPVPIADMEVRVQEDYVGRNAGHFSAVALADGKELIRATALFQREDDVGLPDGLPGHPLPQAPKTPDASPVQRFPFAHHELGYPDLVETRIAQGRMFAGPSAVWFRMSHPLVQGQLPSPYQRVAVAADSGNGISAILDLSTHVFVNSDLTINLLRKPVGEWVCLDARTHLSSHGGGLAESSLYDEQGLIGRATQSLFVRKRP